MGEEQVTLASAVRVVGKALFVSPALGVENGKTYEGLTEEVLKAYQIAPEYDRVKFKSTRKGAGQKYSEYAQLLTKAFNKWWMSLEASASEFCLMELFLQGVDQRVGVFLFERPVRKFDKVARVA